MPLPILPPPVDISAETKKGVIDGLKKILDAFKALGLMPPDQTYQGVVHEPELLFAFVRAYKANREAVKELVVDEQGQPVSDDLTPLVCGVTLEQIEALLVKTCARHYFDSHREEAEPVIETRTTTRFLFFTRTEQVERKPGPSPDDRKNRELLKYLAFDWQLPLLPAYRQHLIYQQIVEIGDDILALQTPDAVEAFGQFDPALIRKAKQVAEKDFVNVLLEKPAALAGVALWPRDLYLFYRNILGPASFEFFARDKSFFNVVAELDKPLARIYGDVLCYIASENLQELQRLNIDKAGVLIEALKMALGEHAPAVLAVPNFSKDILRRLVESLLHMNQEKDQLAISCQLTCKAIQPQVVEWLARQNRRVA